MKITVKTNVLKTLLDKVSKGADEQGLQAISTCVSIEVAKGNLVLRTTNRTHLLKVTEPKMFSEDVEFYACVPNQIFWKLISKMSVPEITLEIGEKTLNVKGNGDYAIPLSFDVDGTICRIHDIPFEEKEDVRNEAGEIVSEKIMEPKSFELTSAQMKDILNYNAASAQRVTAVAGTVIGYYVDKNGFITYDSTACLNNLTLSDVKAFMPSKMMELCQVFTGEKVKFELLPSIVRVTSGNDELTYKLQDSSLADNYPVAQIRSLAEREFTGSCKVNKSDLLDALDRLSLFIKIGPTQILARLRLIFEKDKLTLFDPYGKNIEVLKTADVVGLESFTQDIDLTYFKSLLSCHERDNLQLSYGNDVGVMITDNNIVQLIPYLEEDPSLANTVSTEYNDNEDASFASIAHSDDDEEAVSLSDIATEDTYTFEG